MSEEDLLRAEWDPEGRVRVRVLAEREMLLSALRKAATSLGDARSELAHCWAQERPPSRQAAEDAGNAEDDALTAIKKAEEFG